VKAVPRALQCEKIGAPIVGIQPRTDREGCVDTPSLRLATIILERLVVEHLLSEEDAKKLRGKLAEGKLQGHEWRLPIELAAFKGAER
jgi:hypothetical protein